MKASKSVSMGEIWPGYTSMSDRRHSLIALIGAFKTILDNLEPDPDRSGIAETPIRAAKAWQQYTAGYAYPPDSDILKAFDDGGEGYTGAIRVAEIPFFSHCEHHLAPFYGTAAVSYLPRWEDGTRRIVGLSKIARIVDKYSRRLQVQERLTAQIAEAIFTGANAEGVLVQITARHFCMECRGVEKVGASTTTEQLRYRAAPFSQESRMIDMLLRNKGYQE